VRRRARPGKRKDIESLEVGRIVPIYESAANTKLTSRWFRRIIHALWKIWRQTFLMVFRRQFPGA